MNTQHPRAQGLDGLRALAVTAVVVYHVHAPWLPGGFLGVDLFFVLSGYLITSLLAADRRRGGRLRLVAFWRRRALRLLPVLWLVLAVTACAATLVGGDGRRDLRGAVAAALTYRSNWWQLGRHDMYFAQFGAEPPLRHLWSLAVEEQFYVAWPLLLWALMAVVRRQWAQAAIVAVPAAASFTAMALLHVPGTDPSRVYYGTDTHGGALLLGAAVALVLPLSRAGTMRRAGYVRAIDGLGVAGLAVLTGAALLVSGTSALVYRGGLVPVCLAAAALTVAAGGPGRVARLLGWRPLAWTGRRSYGIYLWHWPVLACLVNAAPEVLSSPFARCAALTLPVALAALSYRVLEEPLLRLGVRGYAELCSTFLRRAWGARPRLVLGAAAAGVAMACVGYVGVLRAPSGGGLQSQIASGERVVAAASAPVSPTARPAEPLRALRPARQEDGPDTGTGGVPEVTGADITAVGDSVMLASADALQELLPGIAVDAVVGRQMSAAPQVLERLRDAGRLRGVVVVGLGTNGDVTRETLDRVVRIAGPGRLVAFVDVQAPRSWEARVNSALREGVREHPGSVLVPWRAVIAGHPQLLWGDRIHPRPEGARLYARTLSAAVGAGI
ncbi:acyltransferase family protein [Streptomyces sp. NPDC002574]|uniref:acyltransferase family protein n=1 Tax=Streptomyces sp. NPDC002574 TaxID=3364652 RepID=UPI0036B8C080